MNFLASSEHTKITGRNIFRDNILFLGYSASTVSFSFKGKKASVSFISDPNNFLPEHHAFVGIYIDENVTPYKRIELTNKKEDITIYESDTEKTVTLTIMKYTEPEYAVCGIERITIDSDDILPPPNAKERKIQIIGDSITCGYGVEGNIEDTIHSTKNENPEKAYSVRSVRALNADAEIVAWNGKGLISAYIGDEFDEPDTSWLLSMLYDYTDAGLENQYFHTPKDKWEKWDNSLFEPDLIMIHIGTNDASYTREIPERNKRFEEIYVDFLETVHKRNPKAKILCMLGLMDQRLCSQVDNSVNKFKTLHPDTEISYLPLPFQKEEDGLGTFWHPSSITHEKAAALVVKKAKEMMNW